MARCHNLHQEDAQRGETARVIKREKRIELVCSGLSKELTRTEYVDLIYRALFMRKIDIPSLNALKLKEARDLANHLMSLKIEVI